MLPGLLGLSFRYYYRFIATRPIAAAITPSFAAETYNALRFAGAGIVAGVVIPTMISFRRNAILLSAVSATRCCRHRYCWHAISGRLPLAAWRAD